MLSPLIARRDEREHQVRRLGVKGDVADLVDDDQGDEAKAAKLGLERALALVIAEPGDPLRRGCELDPLAARGRRQSKARSPDGSCRSLAGPRGPRSRGRGGSRAGRGARFTCFLTERWKVKSNSSSVLRAGKRRRLDSRLAAVGLARGNLGREQRLGEAFIAPGLRAGPLGELRQRPRRRRGLEAAKQVGELGGLSSCRDQRVVVGERAALDTRALADVACALSAASPGPAGGPDR